MNQRGYLTEAQKLRLSKLEPQLARVAQFGDLSSASRIYTDIDGILKGTSLRVRLAIAYNRVCEAAIEAGEFGRAIAGLRTARESLAKETRAYLEATSLLAIAHLRNQELEKAKPMMREVLQNDSVIKSTRRRAQFRKSMIERFNQEFLLYSLKGIGSDTIDENEILEHAEEQARSFSPSEILASIGEALPPQSLILVMQVDEFSKNLLPSAERLLLPSPKEQVEPNRVGPTFFNSIKRTFYRTLCDPNSDLYKSWFKAGFGAVLNRTYVAAAITAAFVSKGIAIKALAVSVVAFVLKFGIEVFCDRYAPDSIMGLR